MQAILEYAEKANILLPILLVILVITYAKAFLNLWDTWKMQKVKHLTSLHENTHLFEETQALIKEEINNAAFQSAFGMSVGTLFREHLVALYRQNKETITWKRLKMALPYLDVEDDKVVVKIGVIDKVLCILTCLGIGLSIILYFIAVALLIMNMNPEGLIQHLPKIFIAIGLFFMNLYQFAHYYHARKLQKELFILYTSQP